MPQRYEKILSLQMFHAQNKDTRSLICDLAYWSICRKKVHSIGIFLSYYRVCNTFVISCNKNVILCNKSVIFHSRLLAINAYKFAATNI